MIYSVYVRFEVEAESEEEAIEKVLKDQEDNYCEVERVEDRC